MACPVLRELLLLVVLLIASVHLCKDPSLNATPECGCIRRPTFEQSWLDANYPQLAEANKAYTFSAPEVTYPNCSKCVVTCPKGELMANLDYATGLLTVGTARFPNPTLLNNLICVDHVWYNAGLGSEMDSNFNSSALSCALKK